MIGNDDTFATPALPDSLKPITRLFSASCFPVAVINGKGIIYFVNQAFTQLVAFPEEDLIGRRIFALLTPEMAGTKRNDTTIVDYRTENWIYAPKDGGPVRTAVEIIALSQKREEPFYLALHSTITSCIASREGMDQAETIRKSEALAMKNEAIMRLSAKFAHDFNNILTAIAGYSSLLTSMLPPDDPSIRDAEQIKLASERATKINQKLLAFGRKQMATPKIVNASDLMFQAKELIEAQYPDAFTLSVTMPDDEQYLICDPGTFKEIILTLANNAADSMGDNKGDLSIWTERVCIDPSNYLLDHGLKSGDYLVFHFQDDGEGIEQEDLEKVFEPFFSTKPKLRGKPRGLSLAAAYGMMVQNGGMLVVESEKGKGADFMLYFQLSEKDDISLIVKGETDDFESDEKALKDAPSLTGDTILIADDEPFVLAYVMKILKKSGYKTIGFESATAALEAFEENPNRFSMLLTDVRMPELNGRQLADKILAARPELPILFMSGYSDEVISHHGILVEGTNLIFKPFTIEGLDRKVKEVLSKQPTKQ